MQFIGQREQFPFIAQRDTPAHGELREVLHRADQIGPALNFILAADGDDARGLPAHEGHAQSIAAEQSTAIVDRRQRGLFRVERAMEFKQEPVLLFPERRCRGRQCIVLMQ